MELGLVPPEVAAPETPATVTTTTTDSTTTSQVASKPSWLHANVRNLLLLAVTGIVCYLALQGVQEAVSAIVVTFASLASYLFAERAALKTPSKDS